MNFYIALGQSGFPLNNYLMTETEVDRLKDQPGSENYTFVPIEVPWKSAAWSQIGGQGKSAYPPKMEVTTMRVPKAIAYEVKQYAVWRAQQDQG